MGYKKPERRGLHDLLHPHIMLGQMQRDGWLIRTRCLHCQLDLLGDFEVLIRMNGHDFKPWGRAPRCRRVGCDGTMVFMGSPPGWHLTFWPLVDGVGSVATGSVLTLAVRQDLAPPHTT